MPFSLLLLTATSPGRHITGSGKDRVSVDGLQSGEFALCFDKVDTTEIVRYGLEIPRNQQCCDGVIFYTSGQLKVICLVEMKHSDIKAAAEQIKQTYNVLRQRLQKDVLRQKLQGKCDVCKEVRECSFCKQIKDIFNGVIWRAYVYCSAASPLMDTDKCKTELLKCFDKSNIAISGNTDITDFLRKGAALGNKRKR